MDEVKQGTFVAAGRGVSSGICVRILEDREALNGCIKYVRI